MSSALGRFEDKGKYFKDFFFLKDAGLYHLIYNVGEAGGEQAWNVDGNEDSFGHATSKDLKHWDVHEPVMYAQRNSWEGMVISAPCIRKIDGAWKMLYTGFSDKVEGCQAIGLAESPDLREWTRYENNPVYIGPDWSAWRPDGWADCRDPHFIEYQGHYVMYTSVRTNDNRGAIAIARSEDLINWETLGWAFTESKLNEQGFGRVPESPLVIERNGKYYLFTSQNDGYMSDDPEATEWERFEFAWCPDGFYAAMEAVQEDDRFIVAAFNWKMNGNYIEFWPLQWKDGIPYIDY